LTCKRRYTLINNYDNNNDDDDTIISCLAVEASNNELYVSRRQAPEKTTRTEP